MLFDVSAAADPHVAPPRIWPPPAPSLISPSRNVRRCECHDPKFSIMREKRGREKKTHM